MSVDSDAGAAMNRPSSRLSVAHDQGLRQVEMEQGRIMHGKSSTLELRSDFIIRDVAIEDKMDGQASAGVSHALPRRALGCSPEPRKFTVCTKVAARKRPVTEEAAAW